MSNQLGSLLLNLLSGGLTALGNKLGSLPFLGIFDTTRGSSLAGLRDAIAMGPALTRASMYNPAGMVGTAAATAAQRALAQPDFSADALLAAEQLRGDADRLRTLAGEATGRALRQLSGQGAELARAVRQIGSVGGSAAALGGALRAAGQEMGRSIAQTLSAGTQAAGEYASRAGQLGEAAQRTLEANRQTIFATRKQPYLVNISPTVGDIARQLSSTYGETVGINNPFIPLAQSLGMLGTAGLMADWAFGGERSRLRDLLEMLGNP